MRVKLVVVVVVVVVVVYTASIIRESERGVQKTLDFLQVALSKENRFAKLEADTPNTHPTHTQHTHTYSHILTHTHTRTHTQHHTHTTFNH